jgi:hypothetical protein
MKPEDSLPSWMEPPLDPILSQLNPVQTLASTPDRGSDFFFAIAPYRSDITRPMRTESSFLGSKTAAARADHPVSKLRVHGAWTPLLHTTLTWELYIIIIITVL